MITNSKLLIDANCPMCKAYGGLFKRIGFIDENVLATYQDIDKAYIKNVDMQRAKSEIALIDTENNRIEYGVDSFMKILFHKNERFLRVLNWPLIRFLLRSLYFFISLNRHIIVRPSLICSSRACDPPLHRGYRLSYALATAVITGYILCIYFSEILTSYSIKYPIYLEYLICLGQIGWQGTFMLFKNKSQFWNYLGHMSTVSILGGLLLLPPLAISSILALSPLYLLGSFFLVLLIMIHEHIFRCKRLGIDIFATISWISYRIVVLILLAVTFIKL